MDFWTWDLDFRAFGLFGLLDFWTSDLDFWTFGLHIQGRDCDLLDFLDFGLGLGIWTFGLLDFGRHGCCGSVTWDLDFWTFGLRIWTFGLLDFWTFGLRIWTFGLRIWTFGLLDFRFRAGDWAHLDFLDFGLGLPIWTFGLRKAWLLWQCGGCGGSGGWLANHVRRWREGGQDSTPQWGNLSVPTGGGANRRARV